MVWESVEGQECRAARQSRRRGVAVEYAQVECARV